MSPDNQRYRFLSNPEVREALKEGTLRTIREIKKFDPELIFFLDKSARPLAQLLKGAYPLVEDKEAFPPLRFINFGTEKIYCIQINSQNECPSSHRSLHLSQLIKNLHSEEQLTQLFPPDDLQYLVKLLNPNLNGRKLLIDDVFYSGRTMTLLQKMVSILDPRSTYQSLPFIINKEHQLYTDEDCMVPQLPWHGIYTLVRDPQSNNSFRSVPQLDEQRKTSLLVRNELNILINEMINDYF